MYSTKTLTRLQMSQEDALKHVNHQLSHMRSDKPQARARLLRKKEYLEIIIELIDEKLSERHVGFMRFGEKD